MSANFRGSAAPVIARLTSSTAGPDRPKCVNNIDRDARSARPVATPLRRRFPFGDSPMFGSTTRSSTSGIVILSVRAPTLHRK